MLCVYVAEIPRLHGGCCRVIMNLFTQCMWLCRQVLAVDVEPCFALEQHFNLKSYSLAIGSFSLI